MTTRLVVCGAGGHGTVVLEALRALSCEVVAIVDRDAARHGSSVMGTPIVGGDDVLSDLVHRGVTHFVVGVGSVGDSTARRLLFERAVASGLQPFTLVHRAAWVSPSATLEAGATVLAGAIVGTAARLERNALINSGAIVEHDCRIGAHAHVATGARLAGGVDVGAGSHVGIGAVVREGVTIGCGAIVGAGAVVLEPVADGLTVVGVPARVVSRLAGAAR